MDGKEVPLGEQFTLRDGLPVFRIKKLCELLGYTCEISPSEIKITAASEKELAYLASIKPNEWYFDSYGDDEGWDSAEKLNRGLRRKAVRYSDRQRPGRQAQRRF